ncbi:MAG: AraC family transcriptional regulator [Eubacteriales bacterium]|nr:AraC family transcriptional regulator [Eubacteriales bacterium]
MENPENNHELSKDRINMLQASINRAFLNDFDIPSRDMVVGKYNIFKDPEVEKMGALQFIKEIFGGRGAYTIRNIKVPIKSIREAYQTDSIDVDAMYQDVTGFPIFDEHGEVSHVVLMFITPRRVYKGKAGISKAIEYLDNHWDKKFDLKETAKAANLSPSHFIRVFKSDMGITPKNLKIENLMEKLRDPNFTVKESFDACGLEYTGQIFGIFKNRVGVTPAQYREMTMK